MMKQETQYKSAISIVSTERSAAHNEPGSRFYDPKSVFWVLRGLDARDRLSLPVRGAEISGYLDISNKRQT